PRHPTPAPPPKPTGRGAHSPTPRALPTDHGQTWPPQNKEPDMATATQTHPIDLDEITTHTHDITAIQTVITDEIQGATALDINGQPVSLLDTTGDTLKEAALEMQNYFNLYDQDVVRDFLIEDVTYDHNTIIVTLTGEISVNTENRCSNPQYLWSQVIIAATPRNH